MPVAGGWHPAWPTRSRGAGPRRGQRTNGDESRLCRGPAGRDVVVRAFLAFLLQVLALVALVGLVGDDADLPAGRLLDEAPGGLPYLDLGHAQLGGPGHPGDQRGGEDRGDEEGGDLDAVGSLEDVRDGGVGEQERDDAKGDGRGSLAVLSGGQGH